MLLTSLCSPSALGRWRLNSIQGIPQPLHTRRCICLAEGFPPGAMRHERPSRIIMWLQVPCWIAAGSTSNKAHEFHAWLALPKQCDASCHMLSVPHAFHCAPASTPAHAEVATEPTCAAIASAVRARLDTGAAPLPAPGGDRSSLLTAASTSLSARAHAAASAAAAHPVPKLRDPQRSPSSLCAVCQRQRSGMVRPLFPARASVPSAQAALALECFDDASPIVVGSGRVLDYHAQKKPLEVACSRVFKESAIPGKIYSTKPKKPLQCDCGLRVVGAAHRSPRRRPPGRQSTRARAPPRRCSAARGRRPACAPAGAPPARL